MLASLQITVRWTLLYHRAMSLIEGIAHISWCEDAHNFNSLGFMRFGTLSVHFSAFGRKPMLQTYHW